MILLNLNAPQKKQKLKLNLLFIKIFDIVFLLFSTMIICILLLYIASIGLNNEHGVVSARVADIKSKAVGQETELLHQETRELNGLLQRIEAEQNSHINWVEKINQINQIIPGGIQVDQINLLGDSKSFLLKGRAGNRDDLFSFEDTIKNAEEFDNINFPIPNITLKENIPFQFTASFSE